MKAYVVNMESSVARRQAIAAQLKKLGLDYEIVPAVDGRKMTREQLEDKVFDVKEFTGAQAGCMMSHVKVYKLIQERKEDYALILEDDSLITDPKFAQTLTDAIPKLGTNDITLLTYYWCREGTLTLEKDADGKVKGGLSDYFLCSPGEINGIGRAGAYIISKHTAKRLYEFHNPLVQCHADSWIVYYERGIIDGVKCVFPMPVSENLEFGSEIGYTKNALELFGKRWLRKRCYGTYPC